MDVADRLSEGTTELRPHARSESAAIASAGEFLVVPVLFEDIKGFGCLGSEVLDQRRDDELAPLDRGERRRGACVRAFQEADEYAARPVLRRVVQHDIEGVIETRNGPVQPVFAPEGLLVSDLEFDYRSRGHLLCQRIAQCGKRGRIPQPPCQGRGQRNNSLPCRDGPAVVVDDNAILLLSHRVHDRVQPDDRSELLGHALGDLMGTANDARVLRSALRTDQGLQAGT